MSSSFTHRAINSSMASLPLTDQIGYGIGMRPSFNKPTVTCRPIRNLWSVNVFSTFRR